MVGMPVLERCHFFAAVEREEETELGADEKQIGVNVVLRDGSTPYPALGQVAGDVVQVLPHVGALEQYGLKSPFL